MTYWCCTRMLLASSAPPSRTLWRPSCFSCHGSWGHLGWSQSVLKGWAVGSTIHHTAPLCAGPACWFSTHLAAMGHPRLAAGFGVQVRKGLRPSELLGITPEDVLLPEEQGTSVAEGRVAITLGSKTGTKLTRPQSITIQCVETPNLVSVLRLMKRYTPRATPLVPYTLATYN